MENEPIFNILLLIFSNKNNYPFISANHSLKHQLVSQNSIFFLFRVS